MHGGNFNLSGKTAAESLETLRTVSSTAPVGVFYLGDRYTGLRLFQVRSGPQGYDGPVIVRYQADVGDMWVEVSTYTAEQFAKDNPLPTGTPAKTVPAKASPDAVYRQRQPPLTYLVARRGDAIVVVAGNLWGIDTQPIPEAGTHLGSVVP